MSLNTARPLARSGGCGCGCYQRRRRYASDTSDAQWAILAPLLPPPRPLGRPERHHRRAILDAIFYLVDNGVRWRDLPADFPPWQTVYGFLARWCGDHTATGVSEGPGHSEGHG